MIVASLACQASCSYCFGPHRGPIMSEETLAQAIDLIAEVCSSTDARKVSVTFHGGEPLLAGKRFWQRALSSLTRRFESCSLAIQSNLWLLDDELCRLLRNHDVSLGASLDGPQQVTDRQRGAGYFARTMQGLHLARSYGLDTGIIATFTPWSAQRWSEVIDFFCRERLDVSLHAAAPSLDRGTQAYCLAPAAYGRLLGEMLDEYARRRHEIVIPTLDQILQGVTSGRGRVCTFQDCLGSFLVIDPAGGIYPCQRFCGHEEYRLGSLGREAGLDQLLASRAACRMQAREHQVTTACQGCAHIDYCRGGCPYNAWASGDRQRIRDTFCEAYRQVFTTAQQRLEQEMLAEENISAIGESPAGDGVHPLLRRGPLIDIVRPGPHPSETARTCRRIIAARELARDPDTISMTRRLVALGVARSLRSCEVSLAALRQSLDRSRPALNNCYLHITFACQLSCNHCYAQALPWRPTGQGVSEQHEMSLAAVLDLLAQVAGAGFRKLILTGGEPLLHHQVDRLLDRLHEARSCSGMQLVLRTNLSLQLPDARLRRLIAAADRVVVSIDGDEDSHDHRRGRGSYRSLVRNLERFQELSCMVADGGELCLAGTMACREAKGVPGEAVRTIARRLAIRDIRFRPALPLGCGSVAAPAQPGGFSRADAVELIESGFRPRASCGLGQNLSIDPCGSAFPCHALRRESAYLGNVLDDGLAAVLATRAFRRLREYSVDTNEQCRYCELRYLCGGSCRGWLGEEQRDNPDAPPADCRYLQERASRLYCEASAYLGLAPEEG